MYLEVNFYNESLQFGEAFSIDGDKKNFKFVSFKWISQALDKFLIVGFIFLCLIFYKM